jgi:hypothetical protein
MQIITILVSYKPMNCFREYFSSCKKSRSKKLLAIYLGLILGVTVGNVCIHTSSDYLLHPTNCDETSHLDHLAVETGPDRPLQGGYSACVHSQFFIVVVALERNAG